MFSIWWLLAAFLVGTYAGVLLIALMHVCGDVCGDSDARGSVAKRPVGSGNDRHARQATT